MGDSSRSQRASLLRHPIAVGFALFALFYVLHALAVAVGVLLLGFLAVLLATLLSFPLDFFSRYMPRVVALVLTIALIAGALAVLLLVTIPIVTREAARLLEQLPVALGRMQAWWDGLRQSGTVPVLPGPSLGERVTADAASMISKAVPFAVSAGSLVFTGVLLFVLSLFLAYTPQSYLELVRVLVPREREAELDEAWTRLGTTLRGWTSGILLSMLTMGAITAVGLLVAGIDGWFLLGILTFLGTFVPYVGAIASAVPGLLVGLAASPAKFFYAAIVYIVVHLVEGYVVSPFIMKRAVRLRPGVLLFWQMLIGAVFGLPGIVVATPLLACAKVAVGYFYVERRLGKDPQEL